MRSFVALSLAAGALLAAGCGAETAQTGLQGADTAKGKQLFVEKCGSCHALQDAATISQVGPSLDAAFGRARQEGFDESTIFRVTLDQIDLAAPPMPSDLVEGQEAVDVAAYIALVAGKPPQQQTTTGATTGEATTGAEAAP